MRNFAPLIRYALREWPALLALVALMPVTSVVAALQPWPLKILVDHGLGSEPVPGWLQTALAVAGLEHGPLPTIFAAAAAAVAVFLLAGLLEAGFTWGWTVASRRMVYELASDLFSRLQRRSLMFHARHPVGDSLTRLTGDAWCVCTVAENMLVAPVRHLLTLLVIGAMAWRLDPLLAAVSLAVMPALAAAALYFGERLKHQARRGREARARLLGFVHQTLTSIPLVQAFGAETQNRQQFDRLAGELIAANRRETLLKKTCAAVGGLALSIGTGLVLLVGGRRVLSGALSLGGLLVFLGWLRTLQRSFQGLMSIHANLKSVEPSTDRIAEILAEDETVREPPDPRPLPARPRGQRGRVRLDNVRFGYEPGRPVLEDISLDARPGETIALVGPSGAGKTTLVSLIPRLYDPWSGTVSLDGVDVRRLRLAQLRAQISVVLQEPFLLPLTVAQNIAYGRPGAKRNEIVGAALAARADEFIGELPQGYDTILGERGATLSGGERQRLAIARALLKDAPVLILDEPSSALDPHTESLVLEALRELVAGRATFIIAHRFTTLRFATRIVVMREGRIVESGALEELLAARGLFHELYSAQTATVTAGQVRQ
jgi:ATP-binding cassette subfamily B protein